MLYILAFLVAALVSGNNLPVCTGSLISSNIMSRKKGIAMAIIGYAAGLFVEGDLLKIGLSSIMPVNSYLLSSIVLLTALVVFMLAHYAKVPQSLSITMSMAIFGLDIALRSSPDTGFIMLMIAAWIAASAFAAALSFATMRYSYRLLNKRNIWGTIRTLKLLLIIFSFLTAFTLGANTIGFIYALVPHQTGTAYVQLLMILAIIIGSVALSRRELQMMGTGIVAMRYLNSLVSQVVSTAFVEAATLLSIPLSNAQTYVSSIFGSTAGYRTHLIEKKTVLAIIRSWFLLAALSLALGYAMTVILA